MNFWVIFLTGLTTGGLSCLAMQGGLLAGVIANQKEREMEGDPSAPTLQPKSFDRLDWMPVTLFLGAKLVSHTILGFLLGALGSVLTLSLGVRLTMQVLSALFMFAMAMNLLNVHPVFRFVSFQPPRFVRRLLKNSAKGTLFAPATLGFLTFLVPCGVTQAMEVLAINSGSSVNGALIMFAFVLGTFPLFGFIGVATAKLSESLRRTFLKVTAVILIAMTLYSINGVLQVLNFPVTAQRFIAGMQTILGKTEEEGAIATPDASGVQRVAIEIRNNGYFPRTLSVRAGTPVELTLNSNEVYSCALSFNLREFNIAAFLDPTDSQTFRFTPNKKGTYTFACSMGMYTGTLKVI